ncbi:hypothetical protein Bca4012_040313 [Brassica carinata]|uniref:Uncharacterized protein n=1 Tax=Brassica carinata TaxID=52824 RepID=A0A8X7VWQ3_BRACI|nr:hypothetical protein Bca52824_021302 [Brassica carinata]
MGGSWRFLFGFFGSFKAWWRRRQRSNPGGTDDEMFGEDSEGNFYNWYVVEPAINKKSTDFIRRFHETRD